MTRVASTATFGTRYYDPNLGRWTQQDPIAGSIANPGTVDRYVYAGDDPINNIDPSGRSFWGSLSDAITCVGDVSRLVLNGFNAGASLAFGVVGAATADPLAAVAGGALTVLYYNLAVSSEHAAEQDC